MVIKMGQYTRHLNGKEIEPYKIGIEDDSIETHILYHLKELGALSFVCIKELFPYVSDLAVRNIVTKLKKRELLQCMNLKDGRKVYFLSHAGLSEALLIDENLPRVKTPTLHSAAHDLGSGGLYRSCFYKSSEISIEKEVPLSIGGSYSILRADAVLNIQVGKLSESFIIEHDCSTERLPEVNSKLQRYGLYGANNSFNMIFTVCLDKRGTTPSKDKFKELEDEIKSIRKYIRIQKKVLLNDEEIKNVCTDLSTLETNSERYYEIFKNREFIINFLEKYEGFQSFEEKLTSLVLKKREEKEKLILKVIKEKEKKRVEKIKSNILNMEDKFQVGTKLLEKISPGGYDEKVYAFFQGEYDRNIDAVVAPNLNLLTNEIFIGTLTDMQIYFANRSESIFKETFFKFEYGGETIDFTDYSLEPVIVYHENKKMVKRINCGVKDDVAFVLLEPIYSVSDIAKLEFLKFDVFHHYENLIIIIRDELGINFKIIEKTQH